MQAKLFRCRTELFCVPLDMLKQSEKETNQSTPPPITVRVEGGKVEKRDGCYTQPFRIGRDGACEVRVNSPEVSRFHAEIRCSGGEWWIVDLNSQNGTFVEGKKVKRALLAKNGRIDLGINGPRLILTVETGSRPESPQTDRFSLTHYMERYFGDSAADDIGKHTMMIRRAFKQVQKRQKRKFAWIIAGCICLCLAAGAYAVFKHVEVRRQRSLAEDIFYAMKSMEIEFAEFLKKTRFDPDSQSVERLKTYRARRKEMEESYDQFLESLRIYGDELGQEERAIMRIARTFGECEISMPAGFVEEVLAYVKKWQSSPRLEKAISMASRKRYVGKIAEQMLTYDLPPQFFYLALQESNFDVNAIGPRTKYGIAKGMWQFIPSTAAYYGLRTGPLLHLRRPDPRDERHNFGKSTLAAARYLRDIYDTEAQASGLLVIASYNWGQRRVNEIIRKFPENPRERNFWQLMKKYGHELPQQTYDYVFHIVAAAVIGENPRLFGFDFDNPLAQIEELGQSASANSSTEKWGRL